MTQSAGALASVLKKKSVCSAKEMDFLQDVFYLDFDFVQFIFQQRWIGRQGDASAGAIYVKHAIAT